MSISKSIWIRKQMAILAPHVSTSILHFSIRLSASSDGFFWTLPGTEIGRWSFFCSTSRRNHKWWKCDHSCWDYWQTRPGWCLNLSLGGRWTSSSAWPDPVSLARTHTSVSGCSLTAAGLRHVYRLSYSLQLCTLLPPTGNIREANLPSREDVEFLVVEIRHLQAEGISRDGGFSVDKILSYSDCHAHPATG